VAGRAIAALGKSVRFDDMLATVLAQPTPDMRASLLQWRQLVDLLAQRPDEAGSASIDAAYARVAGMRASLPIGDRIAVARGIARHSLPARLLTLFARDHAAVAAPIIRGARNSAAEWIALLPTLGPTARALLRHRDDLEDEVLQALQRFGTTDLVIEGDVATTPAAPFEEPTGSQIRELVARIEAFRQQRGLDSASDRVAAARPEPVDSFRWECGTDGILSWSEGLERGAIIGHSIAVRDSGVDAAVAAAFAARRAFRDLGFRAANGDHWRISGVPLFEGATGRFLGFRGLGRRPRADKDSTLHSASLMGTGIPAVALREMVHELRTPLNAIIGFAELIDGQFLGPAGQRQRARAGDIRDQAQRLARALEDLDLAAKLDDGRADLGTGAVEIAALVGQLRGAFEAVAAERGAQLLFALETGLAPAAIEADAAERLVSRLLQAAIGAASDGEIVGVRLTADKRSGGGVVLSVDRPGAIRGPGAAAMLDPGYAPAVESRDAPALGLGFALRLIRNLARAAGGDLGIEVDAFVLSLPIEERGELPNGQRR